MNRVELLLRETLEDGRLEAQLQNQFRRWSHIWDFDEFKQTVLLRAWEKKDDFQGASSEQLLAWLRRIAWTTAIDHWRNETRKNTGFRQWIASFFRSREETSDVLETKDLVEWLLAGLSTREIRLVFLKYYRDNSMAEIAKILQCTPEAAAQLHFRALEKLRRRIKKKGNSP